MHSTKICLSATSPTCISAISFNISRASSPHPSTSAPTRNKVTKSDIRKLVLLSPMSSFTKATTIARRSATISDHMALRWAKNLGKMLPPKLAYDSSPATACRGKTLNMSCLCPVATSRTGLLLVLNPIPLAVGLVDLSHVQYNSRLELHIRVHHDLNADSCLSFEESYSSNPQ